MFKNVSAIFVMIALGLVNLPARADFTAGLNAYEMSAFSVAFKEFSAAANEGDAKSQYFVGWLYDAGLGIAQDYAEAAKWYRKAADQGNAWAQTNLGYLYDEGLGFPQDHAEALKWYRKAADQGNAQAQTNVGTFYKLGEVVSKDDAEALAWFRKAAQQGYAGAHAYIAEAYEKGLGVPENMLLAYVYYSISLNRGNESTASALTNRDALARKLTPEQLSEAQALVSSWTPGSPLP